MKIGIDLGGSHIGVGLIDDLGKLLVKKEIDIKREDKAEIEKFIIKNITKLINKILEDRKLTLKDIELIGISAPGIIKKDVIVQSKNLNLRKFPIVSELNKYFHIPMILKNDCKAAAFAEKKHGNLKLASNSIFLVIGTGIGGAVFIEGKILEVSYTTGFGMGHTIIKKDGRKCACGNKGCFEAYASIGNLRKMIEETLNLEEQINGKQLIEILKNEELSEKISPVLDEYIDCLSIGICNLINIFGPEIVVLGGSIVYYEDLFLEKLKDNIRKKEYLYNDEFMPKIMMAKLKNDAGMIGSTIEKI